MSRRHNETEPSYGQIKLKCPYKHKLAVILVQPRRPGDRRQTFYLIGDLVKEPKMIPVDPSVKDGELKAAEPELSVEYEAVDYGKPVSVACKWCGETWQALWDMVEPAIKQLVNTPVVTLTLYDRPLC